jgi:hypothetical protein
MADGVIENDFNERAANQKDIELLKKDIDGLQRDLREFEKPASLSQKLRGFMRGGARDDIEQKQQARQEAELRLMEAMKACETLQKEMAGQAMKDAAMADQLRARGPVVLMRPLQFKARPGAQIQEH